MHYHDAPQDQQPVTFLGIVEGILSFAVFYVVFLFIVGAGFATKQYAVQSELDAEREERAVAAAKRNHCDYPGVTVVPEYSAPTDSPGLYRIHGVNRDTKNDATKEIQADSAANAKVKAELDGIIVTSVTKKAETKPSILDEDIDSAPPTMD
jgi:hypothetical protein